MAKQRGFEVVKVYEEEESAWKSGHRRVLASLITDTRQRRFQAVLVWALVLTKLESKNKLIMLIMDLLEPLTLAEIWAEYGDNFSVSVPQPEAPPDAFHYCTYRDSYREYQRRLSFGFRKIDGELNYVERIIIDLGR